MQSADRSLNFILVAAVRYGPHDLDVLLAPCGTHRRGDGFLLVRIRPSVCVWFQEGSEVAAIRVSGLQQVPNSVSRSTKPAGVSFGFRQTASILLGRSGTNSFRNRYAVSTASPCNLGGPVSDAARWDHCGEPMYSVGLAGFAPKRPSADTTSAIPAGLTAVGAGLRMSVDIFPEIDIPADS